MAKKSKGASLEQAMPSVASDTSTQTKQDPLDSYEVKDHLDTLMKAHKILNDPEKMQHVHKLAGRHNKAIKSIQDIKNHYNMKFGPKKALGLDDLAGGDDESGE